MGKREAKKGNKGVRILIIVLVLLILIAGGVLAMKIIQDQNKEKPRNEVVSLGEEEGIKDEKKEEPIKSFSGNARPIAVMIDNHKGAWPQAGLNQAYCVYEIIAEGGETRLMALFKGVNLEQIGPVRSARHYFLDYALENSAIYVHYGWSPQAESDISSLGVNNINGITESEKDFWRIKRKAAPHNVMTKTESILKIAEKKGYKTTSELSSVLKYTAEEVNLETENIANTVTIPYSTLHTVSYEYNPETKMYTRYARNKKQTDFATGEAVTTKNIIITFAKNYDLRDGEGKDRQGLENIGTKKGYYITNGKAIEITCTKKDRYSKTIYADLEGNEIKVNDGNTFINICPIDAKVTFE